MRRWLFAVIIAIAAATPATADEALDAAFDKDVLVISASTYACHRFDIYLAINNEQRARGLMHVHDLPQTTGMLFVYESADFRSMWMKNTYIPLDMVFARADGTVSSVAHDTEPLSLRSIVSLEPVTFVLELNAGTAARLFIDENSRLYWEPSRGDDK